MEHFDINDDRHSKLLEEVQNNFDEEQLEEVFFFDHVGGQDNCIHTRTAVIKWDNDQYLVLQTHYWIDESEPAVIRLPAAAVKFMCADLMERSIFTKGFRIGSDKCEPMEFTGWKNATTLQC